MNRYVPLNPVRAGLVVKATDWPWSSARAQIAGQDTPNVTVAPAVTRIPDFAAFLGDDEVGGERWETVLKAEQIGRPVGARPWLEQMERQLGRSLMPRRRGRKPRRNADAPT
jgi:putative transposase